MSKRLRLSLKGQKSLINTQENIPTVILPRNDLSEVDENYMMVVDDSSGNDQGQSNQENIGLTQPANVLLLDCPPEKSNRNFDSTFPITTLDNLGNTCYLNSVVYVLRYVKEFRRHLHDLAYRHQELIRTGAIYDQQINDQHTVILQLHELMRLMRLREVQAQSISNVNFSSGNRVKITATKPVKPVKFVESIRRANSIYDGKDQHDAHELLGFILNWIETTFQCFEEWSAQYSARRKSKRINKNCQLNFHSSCLLCPSQTTFEGINVVKTTCLECETVSKMEDKFRDISVPYLLTSKFEKEQNIKNVFRMKVTMFGEDKVWCNNCQHYNEAWHSSIIMKLPPILVLQLKQLFSFSEFNHTPKMQNQQTSIPKVLPCILDACDDSCSVSDHTFSLGAVICHIGSTLDSGHYTVYLNENMASGEAKSFKPVVDQSQVAAVQINGRHGALATRRRSSRVTSSDNYVGNEDDPIDLVGCNDDCCEPLMFPSNDRWLYFNDEAVQIVDEFPEFNMKQSCETPYLLFYYKG